MEVGEERLTVVVPGIEEEEVERLKAALGMDIDGDSEGEGD